MKRAPVIFASILFVGGVGTVWFLENVHYIILNRMVQKDWRQLFDGYEGNPAMVATYEPHPKSESIRGFTTIYCEPEREFYVATWHVPAEVHTIEGAVTHFASVKSLPTSEFRVFKRGESRRPEPGEKWTGEITIYLPNPYSEADYWFGQRAFRVVVLEGKVIYTQGWRTDW